MGVEIHPVADERERRQFVAVLDTVFGIDVDDDELAAAATTFEVDRSLAVRDGGRIVATAAVRSFRLTVPGPAQLPCAGVTAVGVLPTHRRRGLASALMARQQDEIAARGEAVAALIASEYPIYGRFGYGPGTHLAELAVTTDGLRLAREPDPGLEVRLLLRDEMSAVLPPLFARHVAGRVGQVTRSDAVWARKLRDPERHRAGRTAYRAALVADAAGEPRGYALYRSKEDWTPHALSAHVAAVEEVVTLDDAAGEALWAYLLRLDLHREVRFIRAPVDEVARHLLLDARRARTEALVDWLWVRLIDPAAALAARTYAAEGELVVEVVDGFRTASGGRFALHGGPDGADCAPTTRTPDLVMAASTLGALYLGATAPGTLARARLVEEHAPGALARADVMFPVRPAPFCTTHF